jgi:hypothetical protein
MGDALPSLPRRAVNVDFGAQIALHFHVADSGFAIADNGHLAGLTTPQQSAASNGAERLIRSRMPERPTYTVP